MKSKQLHLVAYVAALAFVAAGGAARADLIALTITGGTTKSDFSGSVGYSFTVGAQAVTVTQLGYYNGPGFLPAGASHQVAIYNDATQAQMGTVATITGTATTAAAAGNGQFVYTPVTPFFLAANTTYDISASNLSTSATTGGNADYLVNATGSTTGSDITYGTSRFAGNSSTVVYPSSTFAANNVGNIGGDFQYTVPEPAGLAAAFGLIAAPSPAPRLVPLPPPNENPFQVCLGRCPAAGAWAGPRARAAAITYMAVGDSITEGKFAGNGGYRQFLQNDLAGGGFSYNFVGKEDNGVPANNTGFSTGMADPNHEGYGSFRIDEILNGSTEEGHTAPPIATTLANYQPNVVLLMIGTNDVLQNFNLSTAPSRLDSLVNAIFTNDKGVKLYLASITPLANSSQDALAVTYNSSIPGIVSKYAAMGDNAHFVDMHSALNPATDLSDGIHPTSGGFQKMATTWYARDRAGALLARPGGCRAAPASSCAGGGRSPPRRGGELRRRRGTGSAPIPARSPRASSDMLRGCLAHPRDANAGRSSSCPFAFCEPTATPAAVTCRAWR